MSRQKWSKNGDRYNLITKNIMKNEFTISESNWLYAFKEWYVSVEDCTQAIQVAVSDWVEEILRGKNGWTGSQEQMAKILWLNED